MHEKGIGRIPDAVLHARFVRALPDEYSLVKETLQAMRNRDRDEIIRMVSTRHSNLPQKNGAQRSSRQPEQAFISSESGSRSGARRGRDRRSGGGQGRGRGGSSHGGLGNNNSSGTLSGSTSTPTPSAPVRRGGASGRICSRGHGGAEGNPSTPAVSPGRGGASGKICSRGHGGAEGNPPTPSVPPGRADFGGINGNSSSYSSEDSRSSSDSSSGNDGGDFSALARRPERDLEAFGELPALQSGHTRSQPWGLAMGASCADDLSAYAMRAMEGEKPMEEKAAEVEQAHDSLLEKQLEKAREWLEKLERRGIGPRARGVRGCRVGRQGQ